MTLPARCIFAFLEEETTAMRRLAEKVESLSLPPKLILYLQTYNGEEILLGSSSSWISCAAQFLIKLIGYGVNNKSFNWNFVAFLVNIKENAFYSY